MSYYIKDFFFSYLKNKKFYITVLLLAVKHIIFLEIQNNVVVWQIVAVYLSQVCHPKFCKEHFYLMPIDFQAHSHENIF